MTDRPRRLLVTAGDPAGIGPETVLKAFSALAKPGSDPQAKVLRELLRTGSVRLEVIGSRVRFEREAEFRRGKMRFTPQGSLRVGPGFEADWHEIPLEGRLGIGKVSRPAGAHAWAILERSFDLLRGGASAVVTAPVSKEAIHLVKPGFLGHTEAYAEAFGVARVSMAFLSPVFHLVLMTTHVRMADLPARITPETVRHALRDALILRRRFGVKTPVCVLGFNPHAGEGGLLGDEEATLVKEIRRLRRAGESVEGPFAADSAFVDVLKGRWKVVVACYHDQGLIPLKMLSKGKSVNVTLGLPVVRTSVDHGTAFDIAGRDVASGGSMVAALHAACELLGPSVRPSRISR